MSLKISVPIYVVIFFLVGAATPSCSTSGVESRGKGVFLVRCEEDIVHCYDLARQACESPFEVRTRYKDPKTGVLETYIQCK